eukprot:1404882-Alexandrium_andersonii.AAC.1
MVGRRLRGLRPSSAVQSRRIGCLPAGGSGYIKRGPCECSHHLGNGDTVLNPAGRQKPQARG